MTLVNQYILRDLINALDSGDIDMISMEFKKYVRRYPKDDEFQAICKKAIKYIDLRIAFESFSHEFDGDKLKEYNKFRQQVCKKDEEIEQDLKKKLEELKSVRFPAGGVESRYQRALRTKGQMHDDYRHGEQHMREDPHNR